MVGFVQKAQFLADHASDADERKSTDGTEGIKHYIDIDYYPEFKLGNLPHSMDSIIAKYGVSIVYDRGIIPWATVWVMDSLTSAMKRGDWNKALQFSADLGHYVADAHQPLHATKNYDGQETGNKGIHSRFESGLIDRYSSQISILRSTVSYITNPLDFVFTYITGSNARVADILRGDNTARSETGQAQGDAYYAVLWREIGQIAVSQMQAATEHLASLCYTGWVNAGKPTIPSVALVVEDRREKPYVLLQNYPNPFNPRTVIRFRISGSGSNVSLKIYDVLGKELKSLVDSYLGEGEFQAEFDGSGLSSGVYFYQLSINSLDGTNELSLPASQKENRLRRVETKKMILAR
jgi:hypothetical protein